MASNMNRDSTRRWRQPWQKTLPKLHITPFSKCEVGHFSSLTQVWSQSIITTSC